MARDNLRIAIIGGSISGCTLAKGLDQLCNIDFDLFDSRPSLTETGASIGLANNAMNALEAMGIDSAQAMRDSGAAAMISTRYLVGIGEHKGKLLAELPDGVISVTRNGWLRQLLKDLPEKHLHTNKKLISIDQPNHEEDPYTLRFEDGSSHLADAVIGCDGIYSKVREVMFGPEQKPRFGGYWNATGKLSPEQALNQFGTEFFNPLEPREVALIGDGASMLFVPNDNGELYHVIVAGAAGPNHDQSSWKTRLSREYLEETYKGWDFKFKSAVIDNLMAADSGPGVVLSHFESLEASAYCHKRLCILGDAAHATIPWLGQGACMATEDAALLKVLLESVTSCGGLEAAFKVFDAKRRGRPEQVMRLSHDAAKLLTGQFGLDPAMVRELNVASWWQQFWRFDMRAHIRESVEMLHSLNMPSKGPEVPGVKQSLL